MVDDVQNMNRATDHSGVDVVLRFSISYYLSIKCQILNSAVNNNKQHKTKELFASSNATQSCSLLHTVHNDIALTSDRPFMQCAEKAKTYCQHELSVWLNYLPN